MGGRLQKGNKKGIVIITGQTGTGKTSLALMLAKEINGKLVSFDSRQCYRFMNIITGKDTTEQVYMYNEYLPSERVNAFDYISRADGYIKSIIQQGKIPIIVGGTMFYIKSYLEGLSHYSVSVDWENRIELEKNSVADLQGKLRAVDKRTFEKMNSSDRLNKRRLIRAIERKQGKKEKNNKIIRNDLPYILVCLTAKNEIIKARIKKRVDERLNSGAVNEVKELLIKEFGRDDPGIKTIGYSQIGAYLKGEHLFEKAVELWINAEYHYAKRQKVFISQFDDVNLFDIADREMVEKVRNLVYKWVYHVP